tara:strand:+ start:118 stop:510 length:393 start_codon:yes stop_codon:yes gene_type:complete
MPLTEEQRKYQREYKKKNPQKMTDEQKEKRKLYMKEYNEKKKLERSEYYKIHNQKPEIKKQRKINEWKNRGLIVEDYDFIYNKWFNATNCEVCNIILTNDNIYTRKCMDHCHITGEYRNILCHPCNVRIR